MLGIVKRFDCCKGYGFISYNSNDVFVHITQLENTNCLFKGQVVEFDLVNTLDGYKAKDVKVVK